MNRLSIEESTNELLNLRNPWDDGYDCWSKEWGHGNPLNCMEELKAKYRVFRPSPMQILKTFIELETEYKVRKPQEYESLSQECDLLKQKYIGMQISPHW